MSGLTLEQFADRLGEIMQVIMRASLKDQTNFFAKMNLTMSQFMMLSLLCKRGQTKMSDFAGVLNVTTAALTGMADKLVKEGYVARLSDPQDRRVVMISATAKGKKIVERMDEHRKGQIINMFGRVSENDRQEYLRILERIKSNL